MSYYLETLNLGYETKHLKEQKSIKFLEVSLPIYIGTCFGVLRKCFKLKSTNCRNFTRFKSKLFILQIRAELNRICRDENRASITIDCWDTINEPLTNRWIEAVTLILHPLQIYLIK